MYFYKFLADKTPIFCFLIFDKLIKHKGFYEKKNVVAMSQINMNCKTGSIILKTMFYYDTQPWVIHISRGTCNRGDILIHISSAFARHIPQRGLNKVIWIVAYLKRCCLGTTSIANEFGLSRYIVFICVFKRHNFVCRFYRKIITSDFVVV